MWQRKKQETLIKRELFERVLGKVDATRQVLPVSRKKVKSEGIEGEKRCREELS